MKNRGVFYIVSGQICFAFFIGVCVLLHPGFVLKWNEGGMSNYGIHIKTAVPYSAALFLLAAFSYRASTFYAGTNIHARRLRIILVGYSANVIVMMLSTYVYSLNIVLKDIHFVFGTMLIVGQATASLWMYTTQRRTAWDGVFLVVLLCGDVMSLLTVVAVLHVLFLAEVTAAVGFAGLLIRTAQRTPIEEQRTATSIRASRVTDRYSAAFGLAILRRRTDPNETG